MSNTLAQHFTITINYQGTNPDTFDAETVGDCVFDNLAESDLIDRLDTVVTIEEHTARPTQTDLTNVRPSYTPDLSEQIAPLDLAIISAVTETLDYATGSTTIEDLYEGIARARKIAVPVEIDNHEHRNRPLPIPLNDDQEQGD